ncbi:DUF3822 family protein [Algivirga pacifica]|uniref:DUF3822 domain-containing protein n=1 Tax=Algivirga pacifica TaxID=1162670 RepID=A0ABP9DD06_9BACT
MEDLLLDTLLYKAYANSFDVHNIADYTLCIKVHQSCLSLCIYHEKSHTCLGIEAYETKTNGTPEKLTAFMEDLFSRHAFLNAVFWKEIKVVISHSQYSLIPSELLEEDTELQAFLQLNCSFEPSQHTLVQNELPHSKVTIGFPIANVLYRWFTKFYRNNEVKFYHSSFSILHYLLEIDQAKEYTKTLNLLVAGDQLTFFYKVNSQPVLVNSFTFKSPNDFIYYTLFILEELKLSTKHTAVRIWGDLAEDTPEIQHLKRYAAHLIFGRRPKKINYNYISTDIPEHYAFDLMALMHCK